MELRFSVATLFRLVARLARVRIEDASRNRFALNGIQRDFSGGILSGYPHTEMDGAVITLRANVPNLHVIILLTMSWGHSSGILYSHMVFMERRFICGSGDIFHFSI